jgi:predicted GNAT family N-acyltransferase
MTAADVSHAPVEEQDQRPLVILPADTRERWLAVQDIRRAVFRDEQRLVGMEVTDADDALGVVLVAFIGNAPVATGRLTPPRDHRSAYLSWIATLPDFRGRGFASAIVERLLAIADERGYGALQLSAQIPAIPLYDRFGFVVTGQQFDVRGIPHRAMVREQFPH